MKKKIFLALTVIVCLAAVLIRYRTTYFSAKAYPRGIIGTWYEDAVVSSGQVAAPWTLIIPHHAGGVHDFLIVSDTAIYHPAGLMPYFQHVDNSNFRIAVDKPFGAKDRLYLINDRLKTMDPIDSGGFDLDGIGNSIGGSNPRMHESAIFDPATNQMTVINDDIYFKMIVKVDLSRLKVVDVQRSQK